MKTTDETAPLLNALKCGICGGTEMNEDLACVNCAERKAEAEREKAKYEPTVPTAELLFRVLP